MFTRDESRVLAWSGTVGSPGEVKLWDVSKAEPLQVWKHDRAVRGAVFTRDESRVLAWSRDGAVKLWDVSKAEPLQVWKHDKNVRGAVFTRDESRVLAWSFDGAVKLWDVSKAEPLQVWQHDKAVHGAVFTRDESRVLAWSGTSVSPGEVTLWDAALKDLDLTPGQRIVELEVRSATRLGSAGQLIRLNSNEWTAKVRSPEYEEIQKKMEANERSRTSGIARKDHLE